MNKKELKKLTSNLPLNPGIMGRSIYFNSAVLIPLIKIKGEYHILFQKRAKHIRQGGDICFPGGAYEECDKNFEQTALRETKEELGIKKKYIRIIGRLDTYVAPIGAIIEPIIGVLKKSTLKKIVIDTNEVEKTILIPLSFFENYKAEVYTLKHEIHPFSIDENGNKEIHLPVEKLKLPKTYQKPWGHKSHKVWVYQYNDDVIWGVTAVIINDFLAKYKDL